MVCAIVHSREFATSLRVDCINKTTRLCFNFGNSALSRLFHVVDECVGAGEKFANKRLLVVRLCQNGAHLLKCVRCRLGDEFDLMSIMQFAFDEAQFAHNTVAHSAEVVELLIMLRAERYRRANDHLDIVRLEAQHARMSGCARCTQMVLARPTVCDRRLLVAASARIAFAYAIIACLTIRYILGCN